MSNARDLQSCLACPMPRSRTPNLAAWLDRLLRRLGTLRRARRIRILDETPDHILRDIGLLDGRSRHADEAPAYWRHR